MLATDLHVLYGDVIPLTIFADLTVLDMSLVADVQYGEQFVGNKTVYRYTVPPTEMNLPSTIRVDKPVRVESNQGSFFLPHRDFVGHGMDGATKKVRLTCFVNNSHPEECAFVVDGQLQHFENKRWYAINPRKTHYSFTFKDNTVHYVANIDISDDATSTWLYNSIQHIGTKHAKLNNTDSRQGLK